MKRQGFTLIELLVVIAIIAILMAIGLPALSRASDDTLRSRCEAHLELVRLACQEYAQDYGAYPANLEQLAERGYLGRETTTCSKTGEPFFYQTPQAAAQAGAPYWLSCVDPATPVGRRPHGAGTVSMALTGDGAVAAVAQ